MVFVGTQIMKRVLVLTYQKIGTPPKNSTLKKQWTTLRSLERTFKKITKRGFTTVSPRQILEGNLPDKPVLLLFLDGYLSFYTDVYPLLKTYNLAACVCLPAACVGAHNAWQDPHQEPWQDLLAWEEIKTLAKDGRISFGVQALNREDLSLLDTEQAQYAAQESLARLAAQLPDAPVLFAFSPAQKHLNPSSLWPGFNGLFVRVNQSTLVNQQIRLRVLDANSLRAQIAL